MHPILQMKQRMVILKLIIGPLPNSDNCYHKLTIVQHMYYYTDTNLKYVKML